MDILVNILLWVHLMALVAAGASAVAMPAVGAQIEGAPAGDRERLFTVAQRLSTAARGALVLLLITGPLMFWLKWDFSARSQAWFGVKMLLVLVVLVAVIIGGINMKRVREGNAAAVPMARRMGMLGSLALAGAVFAAVFAFN